MKRVAVAELVSSGKEQLVLIRPYQNGLVMHTAYYANEVRDFSEVPKGESADVGKEEIQLALGLIDRLSTEEFEPDQFQDEYRLRVLAMVEEKAKGGKIEITQAPAPQHGRVIDIMEALKKSMEKTPEREERRAARKKRRQRG